MDGPNLLTGLEWHSITNINSTTSILSGGSTWLSESSDRTWFYEHEKQVFKDGPALLQGRRRHASTIIIDSVTKDIIPVVAGGEVYVHMTLSFTRLYSTELLIDDKWQPGLNQILKAG